MTVDCEVSRWPSSGPTTRTAFIVPGSGYSAVEPLLYWASYVLSQAGFDVISIAWPANRSIEKDGRALVEAGLDAATKFAGKEADAVVAMSLGCLSLDVLPHVAHFLMSPVLKPGYSASLECRTHAGINWAIGGSRDPYWSADAASRRGLRVHELPEANHSLESADSWKKSLSSLGQVMNLVEAFGRQVL
jgi:hypothetical protein